MDRAQKEQQVASLRETVGDVTLLVVTQQNGLNVAEATDLRRKMRHAGANFRVTKNRLARLALKDTKKSKPGSVPLGHLGRLKMRYKQATKARKGTNPFTGEPATFKAKPATLQPRFTAGKALKDEANKYFKKKMK